MTADRLAVRGAIPFRGAFPFRRAKTLIVAVLAAGAIAQAARAADQPQWGQADSRNMVSAERGLPAAFDVATGANVKWVAELGTESYPSPVVAGGRVLIGTNNEHPRDPRHHGDRAVLLCLDEWDGHLLWQFVGPKLSEEQHDPFLDWPKAGFASEPTVEGDRAYTLTNRGEVVCLDMKGMADGNGGPFVDEARHAVPRGQAPIEPGPTDADVLWLCDLVKETGIRTHDQVHGSILVRGDLLYVNACNGVDDTHRVIRKPDAPSLVVLDKRTGKVVARDGLRLGPTTFHCAWSSPSFGVVAGRPTVLFGGPDGVCYAFDPLSDAPATTPATAAADVDSIPRLSTRWRFDCDPSAPKADVHKWIGNRRESPSVIMGMPVLDADGKAGGTAGRVYLTAGGDLWWGKRQGWLKCVDAIKAGEVASASKEAAGKDAAGKGAAGNGVVGGADVTSAAEVWSYPLPRETCSTPAVHDGLVYVADCGGTLHCVDAATGKACWTHKAVGDFWASALVADGKVYAGTRRGQFVVLAAGREKRVLSTAELKEPVSGTATAANGVLYVATAKHLYALHDAGRTQ